jgi:uncharacterized membrane protein required for colicin V production
LIVVIIGYKVGFLTTLLKLTSALSGIIIAICFTEPVTNLAIEWELDNSIEQTVYTNITTSDAFKAYTEGGTGVEGINNLLQELGLPSFISNFVASKIVDSVDPLEIATSISQSVSYVFMFIIVFLILLIFSSLAFFILKLIVKSIRKSVGVFRVLDGIVGIAFYLLIFMLIIYIAFLVISLILQSAPADSGFVLFMEEQLHLNDEEFGIAKYIYKNNMLGNFLGLIF